MYQFLAEADVARLATEAAEMLQRLCVRIPDRCVGSAGNKEAVLYLEERLSSLGWKVECPEFPAMDWQDGGADLIVAGGHFSVLPSPYSLGCNVASTLVAATSIDELRKLDARGRVLLLLGDIAREQLMPKNFVFYNPDEHRAIVSALESSGVSAIICATGHNPQVAGGLSPFPLIEDGDFDIPSVFTTEEEGRRLLANVGAEVRLVSRARRLPSTARNVIARRGGRGVRRIVVSAHIDAKRGSPGAIDDGTGIVALALIAELLKDHAGQTGIEIVAFNGEDYYSAAGEMHYIEENQGRFDEVVVDINIDGAAYREDGSCLSFFGLPHDIERSARSVISRHDDLEEGPPWPQGDHSIFVQLGRPAIAVASRWFIDHMDSQRVTHTKNDEPGIVDCDLLARLSLSIAELVTMIAEA